MSNGGNESPVRFEPGGLTITVREAARRLGVGKNCAYDAARRGDIPVIRIGRRIVVPLAAFEAMMTVQSKQQVLAAELVRRLQKQDD
jgi:excisionase family DNA binding protein